MTTIIDVRPALEEFECQHDRISTVKFKTKNGRIQLVEQCQECGEKIGGFLKQQGWNLDTLGWFDREFQYRKRDERNKQRDNARFTYLTELEQQKLDRQQKWWANYNHYLKSPHWQQLRRSVIYRDQFRCQNCFRAVTDGSAHVHHLSYVGLNRIGKSFAFECVTLCSNCHTEFHPHMSDGDRYE